MRNGVVEVFGLIASRPHVQLTHLSGPFQTLAETELEFTSRLFRKRDGKDLGNAGRARTQEIDDP